MRYIGGNMNIVFDSDATIVDYRRFIDKYAIPYFKRKYNMDVVNENKLEIEDIFDFENVLRNQGYSEEELERHVKKILDKFWISSRYIAYSVPWMFFPKAGKYLRKLKKQGHHIEIHSSKKKTTESNIVGKLARILMYLQYWGNGCLISCNKFKFYKNDDLKMDGIIASSPDVVFEDKPEIINQLSGKGIKLLCVKGKHNQEIEENKNVKILCSYEITDVDNAMSSLLGEKKWKLYNDIAKSDILYKRLLKLDKIVLNYFQPIILNRDRLVKEYNRGVIYVSNHRRTLDPIVINAIVKETIRYAALRRFFDAEDSIFNNNKSPILCKVTAYIFGKLRFFPIEREGDYDNANNMNSIKQMVDYAKIKGKVGIFPEGTTLKNLDEKFNTFNDSFVKLAVATNAIIQPITMYWFNYNGKQKCVVNFGEQMEVNKMNMNSVYDEFVHMQETLLAENIEVAKNMI